MDAIDIAIEAIQFRIEWLDEFETYEAEHYDDGELPELRARLVSAIEDLERLGDRLDLEHERQVAGG